MATLIDNAQQKALTTLDRAKAYLGISGDSKDTFLTMVINQATGFAEAFCKRRFLRQTYTNEVYDGSGTPEIVLKQFPVATLSSLQVNAGTIGSPSWQTIDATLYGFYEDGRITLGSPEASFLSAPGGSFLCEAQKYRATYAAGYLIDFDHENDPTLHTLPQEVEYAVLKLVGARLNTSKSEGLESAKVGDISMSFRKVVDQDGDVKAILEKYASATI